MKKTYYSVLISTFKNKKLWDYYSSGYDFGKELPVISIELSADFLRKFIKTSGKAEQELFFQIDKIKERANHIVSTFLLGHYMYINTNLKEYIDTEIEKNNKLFGTKKCRIEFSYLWFLVCLFHDLGYCIENENSPRYENIDSLFLDSKQLDYVLGVPVLYEKVYKNYYKYIFEEQCKNEHGIVAAHLLYNSLCQIREYAEHDKLSNLYWGIELEHLYNFCSWNILAHNIWFVNESNHCLVKSYEKNNLNELIKKDGEYKISFKEHPFFFLLCLVDTIEPYKKVKELSKLKQISINIIGKEKIEISSKLKCGCHNTIIDQVKSLDNWLIKVEKDILTDSITIDLSL